MTGFEAAPETLEAATRSLRHGGDDLEACDARSPAPYVGSATSAVASALAHLTESTAGIIEGMWQLASATDDAARGYDAADSRAREALDAVAEWTG